MQILEQRKTIPNQPLPILLTKMIRKKLKCKSVEVRKQKSLLERVLRKGILKIIN